MTAAGEGMAPRALGVLGGTFDPIHLGHLALAHESLRELALEQVLFVPNADPPHKQDQAITPARHREAMVSLAIDREPDLVLSRIELERSGPSYAVDTVATLAERSRAEGRPEPWFVLSADVLEGFDAWHEPQRVMELTRIAVAPRPGADPLDADWVRARYPRFVDRFAFLPGPELDIASTDIRDRVASGDDITALVPQDVAAYIVEHDLYRTREARS